MPRKTKNYMQKKAYELSIVIKQADPFPFSQQSLEYWSHVPYPTDEDINYAKEVLTQEVLNRKSLEEIVRLSKSYLKNKNFGRECLFIDLKCFVKQK